MDVIHAFQHLVQRNKQYPTASINCGLRWTLFSPDKRMNVTREWGTVSQTFIYLLSTDWDLLMYNKRM